MATSEDVGSRLLVAHIDKLAIDPSRIWASVPVHDEGLSKGFRHVTYTSLANAINRAAAWLQSQLPPAVHPFEIVAYSGPKDIRYPILAIAVAKIGRKVLHSPSKLCLAKCRQLLLPSPFASVDAQAHLVQASECQTFIHEKEKTGIIHQVLAKTAHRSVSTLQMVEISELLQDEMVPPFPFTKTWEQAKDDPWLIFHTSGTTGMINQAFVYCLIC
jgi:acyl-coenzyme A synthetase/AMP-(fatty) acid ligase